MAPFFSRTSENSVQSHLLYWSFIFTKQTSHCFATNVNFFSGKTKKLLRLHWLQFRTMLIIWKTNTRSEVLLQSQRQIIFLVCFHLCITCWLLSASLYFAKNCPLKGYNNYFHLMVVLVSNDKTTIHNVSFSVNFNILNALFLSIPRIHTFYQMINNLSSFPSVLF